MTFLAEYGKCDSETVVQKLCGMMNHNETRVACMVILQSGPSKAEKYNYK